MSDLDAIKEEITSVKIDLQKAKEADAPFEYLTSLNNRLVELQREKNILLTSKGK